MSKTNEVYHPSFIIVKGGDPKRWSTMLVTALGGWQGEIGPLRLISLLVIHQQFVVAAGMQHIGRKVQLKHDCNLFI